MQINVAVTDANNIVCEVVPPQTQTITIDRGVAGNGIVSIVPVTISTFQYLRITYTNGTVQDVGPLTSTAYTATAPITIVGNTISLATVPIASGGTNATTAADAIQNLLPSYTGNGNKRLGLNSGGTALEWVADGGGTVTSVAMTVPTGLSISGSPITTSGTLALTMAAGYAIPTTASQTNWDTAYSERQQWSGTSTNLVASTGRTSLGATTLGSNLFTITNPSAITFPRFNADNTVSALDAATFRTAIGAGTSSTTGTVTSVAATVPSFLSISGSPITTSGTLAFGLSGTALPTTSGGTGLTSFIANGVVYASSTSALTTGSALTFDGSRLLLGTTTQVGKFTIDAGGGNGLYLTSATGGSVVDDVKIVRTGGAGGSAVGTNSWIQLQNSTDVKGSGIQTYNGGTIFFGYNGTWSEQMRLTGTGVLGVNSLGGGSGTKLNVTGGGSGSLGAIQIGDGDVTGSTNYWNIGRDNTTSGSFTFAVNGSEKIRINTSGEFLVGCTGLTGDAPNALGSTYQQDNGNTKIRVAADLQAAFQFYSVTGGTTAPVGNIGVNSSSVSYFTSATNSGFVGLDANTLGFITSNSEQARITSGGNFGLGTSSPAYKLDVNGIGRIQSRFIVGTSADVSDRMFYVSGSAPTSGSNQFGMVLNPTYPTSVTSTLFNAYIGPNLTSGTTVTNVYNLYLEAINASGSTVSNRWGIYQSGSSDNNYFAGSVGIGTNSPSVKLHVANDGSGEADVARFSRTNGSDLHFLDIGVNPDTNLVTFDSSGSASGGYTFRRGGTDAMTLTASAELIVDSGSGGGRFTFSPGSTANTISSTTTGYAAFNILRTYASSYEWYEGGTQAMTLNGGGNLLIGTTSGSGRLFVSTAETKGQNATPFTISTSDSSNQFQLIFTRNTNTYYKIQSVEQGVGYRDIVMQTDGGNFGIGTTSPSYKLDVGGDTRVQGNLFLTDNVKALVFGTATTSYIIGSSAANNIRFVNGSSEVARFDSTNFGLGTSAPAFRFDTLTPGAVISGTATIGSNMYGMRLQNSVQATTNNAVGLWFSTGPHQAGIASFRPDASAGWETALAFYTHPTTTSGLNDCYEAMRIDGNGNLCVGGSSPYGKIYVRNDSSSFPNLKLQNEASTGYFANFSTNGNSTVGTISFTIGGTAYNTSSDYRLKNTIAPMTGALAKVALLKPCTYRWNADNSEGQGFIAHELAEVVPQCVTGEKDAVDENGSPVYQGIDTSFLVATLTAAIQELKAEFDAYKASHP